MSCVPPPSTLATVLPSSGFLALAGRSRANRTSEPLIGAPRARSQLPHPESCGSRKEGGATSASVDQRSHASFLNGLQVMRSILNNSRDFLRHSVSSLFPKMLFLFGVLEKCLKSRYSERLGWNYSRFLRINPAFQRRNSRLTRR